MLSIYIFLLIFFFPLIFLKNSKNKIIFLYVIIMLIIIAGFRDTSTPTLKLLHIQNDEYRNKLWLYSLIDTPLKIDNIESFEWASYFLDWLIMNLTKKVQVWIFIYSVITNFLFLKFIYKYIKPFWYGIFLYITVGLYTLQFNITASLMCAAILTLTIEPLIKQKKWKYFFIVFIAFGFHFSAVIMFPLYFFINNNLFNKGIIFWESFSLIIAANFKFIANIILINTPYSRYLQDINSENSYGVSIFRVLIFNIIYIFIIYKSKKLTNISKIDILFLKYIKILLFINIVSLNYVYVNRLNELFSFALIYMIPKICYTFKPKKRKIIIFIIYISFFCFGIHQNINIPYDNTAIKLILNK